MEVPGAERSAEDGAEPTAATEEAPVDDATGATEAAEVPEAASDVAATEPADHSEEPAEG